MFGEKDLGFVLQRSSTAVLVEFDLKFSKTSQFSMFSQQIFSFQTSETFSSAPGDSPTFHTIQLTQASLGKSKEDYRFTFNPQKWTFLLTFSLRSWFLWFPLKAHKVHQSFKARWLSGVSGSMSIH
jgi:hypothetical protein